MSIQDEIKLLEMDHKYWHCTALYPSDEATGANPVRDEALRRMDSIRHQIEKLLKTKPPS